MTILIYFLTIVFGIVCFVIMKPEQPEQKEKAEKAPQHHWYDPKLYRLYALPVYHGGQRRRRAAVHVYRAGHGR